MPMCDISMKLRTYTVVTRNGRKRNLTSKVDETFICDDRLTLTVKGISFRSCIHKFLNLNVVFGHALPFPLHSESRRTPLFII